MDLEIFPFEDEQDFFITVYGDDDDERVVEISDLSDASHPGTVVLYMSRIPDLIKALSSILHPEP